MNKPVLVLMMAALAVPAMADEGYDSHSYAPTARIRYVEPSVTLQRYSSDDGSQASSEEAQANVPFLPGDRMWTDNAGRAELQLATDVFIRMDTQSSLEYVSEGARPAFRVDSGGLYVHARQGGDLTIETPGGLVTLQRSGVYRIDADSGETRLTVLQGSASLDSGNRQVDVPGGERTYAQKGEPPEDPQRFDRADSDNFASWDRTRESSVAAYAGESRRYLPAEVASYADDLDANGSWADDAEVGRVWRPNVDADWSPYSDGRWTWTVYGWTWCPYETWGWAPFHYGRWGFGARLGWYWIPGSVWGPAWVSWAHGGDYVGWCPLGFHDRPVIGIGVSGGRFGGRAWFYSRRADILAPQIARHRISASPAVVGAVRVLSSSPVAQPSRDFRTVHTVHAMPVPTARLRSQSAPLPSRSAIRGATTPRDGARVRIPERSPNARPQAGIGRTTDRNGRSTSTAPRQLQNERPVPRSQDGRTTDSGGFNSGTSARRRVDAPPPSASQVRQSEPRGQTSGWNRPSVRQSAPRPVERVTPPAARPAPSRSRDYGSGFGNRSFQPPRQQPMTHAQVSRPPRADSGPRFSQPHSAPPHAESRPAPRPAQASGRDRNPHGR
jgi:hypothetical protein